MALRGSRPGYLPLIAFLAASALACLDLTIIGPGTLTPEVATYVRPDVLVGQSVGAGHCPAFPPFVVAYEIVIHERTGVDVSLEEVHFRLVDHFGALGHAATLDTAELTGRFGSTFIRGGLQRGFTFRLTYGCISSRTGILTLIVRVRDANGVRHTRTINAPVS